MLFHPISGTATLVGGSWSTNLIKFSMGYVRQIILQPTTVTNIYDFSITDDEGFTVFPYEGGLSTAIEGNFCMHKVDIPLRGVYTINISNATVQTDTIKYKILVQED